MAVVVTRFVRSDWSTSAEFTAVASVAGTLLERLNIAEIQAALASAHAPRAPSSRVQAAFLHVAEELGFRNEAAGLFAEYQSRLRPDYFLPVGTTGVLLEVERGKTITNNMDMLDFWKCHLCAHANYLFLLVPQLLRHGDIGFT
ncbi:MAG TPA: hypothetical protein VFM93_14215, partial [Candidatus Limnocylindria bacterium]|nr:hypothetical protein [Candidatus Limnocylindria bacterium]